MQQLDEPVPLPKYLVKYPDEGIPTPPRDSAPVGETNSSEEDKYGQMPGGRSKRERKTN